MVRCIHDVLWQGICESGCMSKKRMSRGVLSWSESGQGRVVWGCVGHSSGAGSGRSLHRQQRLVLGGRQCRGLGHSARGMQHNILRPLLFITFVKI